MTRSSFEARRRPEWKALEASVRKLEARGTTLSREEATHFARLYRAASEDLALARHRGYGADLQTDLNALCLRAYHALHARRQSSLLRAMRYVAVEFPRLVRRERGVVGAALVAFFLPFLTLMAAGWFAPEWVEAALPEDMRRQLELSFSGELGTRGDSADAAMFGFYVLNNVSIAFRSFAGGIFFGVGALLTLLFNGIVLGAAFGYAFVAGFEREFLAFTAGHGAPELLGIVIAGAAGLKLGLAIVAPGRRTRAFALREDGAIAGRLVLGAGAMIAFAALIEGFWSANDVSHTLRYAVGVSVWTFTILWLLFGGRPARTTAAAR